MAYELGIIGAGNMAEAIVRGVTARGLLKPDQILAADVSPERLALFQNQLGVAHAANNAAVAAQSKAILLSVKPQQMQAALDEMKRSLSPQTLIISIAAGISSSFIERACDDNQPWRVIRTMPNTPMLVGEGMVAISRGRHATDADLAYARRIFESAATVIEVLEDKIDAVTAVSGSGPAYFFFLVEQMVRAGIELGLTAAQAHTLATRTALGAAKMLTSSSDAPAELRRKVTSPNGTTHAAITLMESKNWPQITIDAIKAAAQRSREL